jgi:hypothetical protein
MQHYYKDISGIGNVAVSRSAQSQARAIDISEEMFRHALTKPDAPDTPARRAGEFYRDRGVVRLVIVRKPTPFRGASLVRSVIRRELQESPTK